MIYKMLYFSGATKGLRVKSNEASHTQWFGVRLSVTSEKSNSKGKLR